MTNKVLLRHFFFSFQLSSSGLLHRRIFIRRTIIQREQPRDARTPAHTDTRTRTAVDFDMCATCSRPMYT